MATTQSWRRARVSQVSRARWSLSLELLPNRPSVPVSSIASRIAARSSSPGASREPTSSRCARASRRSFLLARALPCGTSPSPSATGASTAMSACTPRPKKRRSMPRAHMANASRAIWAARGSISMPCRFLDRTSPGISRSR